VHRVLGALSGHGPADGPGDEPAPQRGLTTGFPAAPDRAFDRAPVRGPVLGPAAPRPAALPFPRGVAQTFTIGRDRSCDLAIDHLTVSRVHARLQRTGDGWRLSDLGSTNGTRVNGWRVRGGVDVRAGDLVRFGDVEYALGEAGEP
jgi:pSer/pThr/pTyr-binding forkhead associated (FHA) protein